MNTTALEPSSNALIQNRGENVEVSAFQPQEMLDANRALIAWCDRKITQIEQQAQELLEAFNHAVERKWKSTTLKRHHELAKKRSEFFSKIKSALEHGFYIVPNFPVAAFAIRTERHKPLPLALATTSHWKTHEQDAQTLSEGAGEYQNPFPIQMQRDISSAEDKAKNKKVMEYTADAWDEFEFPVNMAKPKIMEATTRAMALKLFDDFGILPSPKVKQDPIVVGRIKDPRSTRYNRRHVSFIIAWHLDTRTL